MDSIDIYVSLMDDIEVSKSLSNFNEKTRSTNTAFKKSKLMKILRNQTSKTRVRGKPKRNIVNPFEFLIFGQKDNNFENIDEKDFFIMLDDKDLNDYPDYKKFANALIYFPERTGELLPKIDENIKNNRKPFQGLVHFDNQEEVVSYITRVSLFSGNEWQKGVENYFSRFFNEEDKEKIKVAKTEIATLTLENFYQHINDDKNDIPLYIYRYAYLLIHNDVDDLVRHCLIEGIMVGLLQIAHDKINVLNKSTEVFEEYSQITKEFDALRQQLDSLEQNNATLLKKLRRKEKEINEIKLVHEERFNKELAKHNKKLINIQNENIKLKEKLNKIELCMKYAFPKNEGRDYMFAVVHCIETRLVSTIYPEILFIHVEEWSNKFGSLPQDIGTVYITREGLTNRQIRDINKDAETQCIKTKMIFAGNEKKMIESIAILKNEQGGNVYV